MMTDMDRISEALQFIPVGGHDERFRIGCMVKSELGDAGRELWDEWRDGRGDDEAASVWKSISETGTLRIGSLFHEAKANDWCDNGRYRKPTAEELAERQRIAAERAANEEAEIARERADTAAKAAAILKTAAEAKADHPYLSRKRVLPVATLREINAGTAAAILGYRPKSGGEPLTGRLLVAPVKQGDRFSTLELIDESGRKAALAGRGSKTGGYWATERLPDGDGPEPLLFCEGVATTLSVREATNAIGIATLSAGNMPTVAKIMRERYPTRPFVFCADLVKSTGSPDSHAVEAALAIGGLLAIPDFGTDRPDGATDFNDMAQLCGKEAAQQAIAQAKAPTKEKHQENTENPPESGSDAWPIPQPMTAKIAPEDYPLDALPDKVRAAVEEVVRFVQAPFPMVASCALSALSLAIQAHVDVKRAEKLSGPVSAYWLIIADSGERKSTCDGFFSRAIIDYQTQQAELAKPILKNYRAECEAWEAKRGGIKDKIRQLAKEGKSTSVLESSLHDLEHQKPEKPRIPRLLYSDVTPEKLAFNLANEYPSGGIVSAEGGLVFGSHGMGSDSVMRNLATLNQLWDGNTLIIDRKTSESFTVRGARLTMALQVQEQTLRSFFKQSGDLARGTGFLARFFVAWPESTQGTRLFADGPDRWPALAAFNQRITEILNQPVPISDDGVLTPLMLDLTPAAKNAWIEYHDVIERSLARGGDLHDVRDVASKSADNAVRLAALFQVFEHGASLVSLDSFDSASRIAAWHLTESRRFFGELALPDGMAAAVRLDSWLVEHCRRTQTCFVGKRNAQQYGPIRDGDTLDAAIRELADLDRVRVFKESKRITIQLNPALLSNGGGL